MKNDHHAMWEKLNLDLDAHDALLEVLGKFYGDIYLSQQNRLKGAEYLDFVVSEIHGLRIRELEEARERGKKVIGTFCIFVPEEITIAADCIQVGLCAGADAGKEHAEKILPRNTCPLIKSFVGFKLARLCPFFESCDLIIGENTCDGKKKAYEVFRGYVPMHVMDLPQKKTEKGRELLKAEIINYIKKLEELTGKKITAGDLKRGIKIVNNKRRVLQRLNGLRKAIPTPISGRDVLLINQISFYDDPIRFTQKISDLCDEIEKKVKEKKGVVNSNTARILVSGCPMAVPNWKLPYVIEGSNAVVVCEESCIGTRNTRDLVAENKDTLEEMVDAIVDRYLKIDCACFTPNEERAKNVIELVKNYDVDGVIFYNLVFCQPYAQENMKLSSMLSRKKIPTLNIETDYSMEDVGQLKTRIEAFVEMISNR
ncbi:double-cubane-cluster-containing anaerobic reductase [Desulfothermus okinawensis JCM 13304]